MILFDYKRLNKSKVWIKTNSVSELRNFFKWCELISTSFNDSPSEYFKLYKEPICVNIEDHYISGESKIVKSKAIIEYKDLVLKGEAKTKEKQRIKKLMNKLIKENKVLLEETHENVLDGNEGYNTYDKLRRNVLKLEDYQKLIS